MSSWNQSLNLPFQLSVILCFFPFCRCFCRQGPTLSDAGPVAGLPPSRTSALRRHFTFKLISIIRKINPSPSPVCQHHQHQHSHTRIRTCSQAHMTHTHTHAHIKTHTYTNRARTRTHAHLQKAHINMHTYLSMPTQCFFASVVPLRTNTHE